MKKLFLFSLGALILSLQSYAGEGREKMREAFDACLTESGVTRPERGERPSDEDKAKIDACLKSKGIEHPGKRGHQPRGQRLEEVE